MGSSDGSRGPEFGLPEFFELPRTILLLSTNFIINFFFNHVTFWYMAFKSDFMLFFFSCTLFGDLFFWIEFWLETVDCKFFSVILNLFLILILGSYEIYVQFYDMKLRNLRSVKGARNRPSPGLKTKTILLLTSLIGSMLFAFLVGPMFCFLIFLQFIFFYFFEFVNAIETFKFIIINATNKIIVPKKIKFKLISNKIFFATLQK